MWWLPLGLWLAYFYLPVALYTLLQHQFRSAASRPTLGLGDYRVTVEAKPLPGITQNLSGLAFRADTGTLWGIANGPSRVVEFTTDGEVLRTIPVRGGKDTEGITHLQGDAFLVVDEKSNTLWQVAIGAHTQEIRLDTAPWLHLELDPLHPNLGIEALSSSARNRSVWVGQEKWPMRVVELAGDFPSEVATQGAPVLPLRLVREWQAQGLYGWLLSDLASMTHVDASGHLLLLSQESRVVVEFTEQGEAVGVLPLWQRMHGLQRPVPQAEGITVDPQGHLYIVAEPNLFYRFEKQTPRR